MLTGYQMQWSEGLLLAEMDDSCYVVTEACIDKMLAGLLPPFHFETQKKPYEPARSTFPCVLAQQRIHQWEIKQKDGLIQQKDGLIQQKDGLIQQKDQRIEQLTGERDEWRSALLSVYAYNGWKIPDHLVALLPVENVVPAPANPNV